MLKNRRFLRETHTSLYERLILASESDNIPERYYDTTNEEIDIFTQTNLNKLSEITLPTVRKNIVEDLSEQLRALKVKAFTKNVLNPKANTQHDFIGLKELGETVAKNASNPEMTLISLTHGITQDAMSISRKMTNRASRELKNITNKLIAIEKNGQYGSNRYRELIHKRTMLEEERNFKIKHKGIAKHSALSDKCTSYHLSECIFTSRPKITSIYDKNNVLQEGANAPPAFIENFKNFFRTDPQSPEATQNTIPRFLRNIDETSFKKILNSAHCQKKITPNELDNVIYANHKKSSPGLSGFSYAALKTYYKFLKPLLLEFVNKCDNQDILSEMLRSRKIIFLRKPNKDVQLFSSYRPICLLEICYKVLSSILSHRIKKYLPTVITHHQFAYLAGRSAAVASRTILDSKNLIIEKKLPACLLALDFSSAFDKISHSFCEQALRFFNFPEHLINKIKFLIKKPIATLIVNGKQTEFFQQSARGSGQGDPISALLFIICIQILIYALSLSPDINRPKITYKRINGSQTTLECQPVCFADDVNTIADTTDINNLDRILDKIAEFSHISNLDLNHKKTEIMFFNSSQAAINRAIHHQLKRTDKIKFVGLYTINKTSDQFLYRTNFDEPNTRAESLMSSIANKSHSSIGATLIYNSKIISKYTHLLFNVHLTDAQSEHLDKKGMEFLVKIQNRYLVKKEKYHMPLKLGGCNLRSFKFANKSLSGFWLKAILNNENTNFTWRKILKYLLNEIRVDIEIIGLIGYKDLKIIADKLQPKSSFWSSTFENFSLIVKLIEHETDDYLSLPAFGGRFSDLTKNNSLSIFSNNKKSNIALIKAGFHMLSNYARPSEIHDDLTNCKLYRTIDSILEQTDRQVTILAYISLTSSMSKLFNVTLKNDAIYLNLEYYPKLTKNCTQSFFKKFSTGCSKLYQMIRQDYIDTNNIPEAPARRTACRDYGIDLDPKIFEQTLTNTTKIIGISGTPATIYKFLIRQNWTRLKLSLREKNPDLAKCLYCPETGQTEHSYTECVVAENIWRILNKILQKAFNFQIPLQPINLIFFQNITHSDKGTKRAITDMHATTLCTLQKIHLAENELTDMDIHQTSFRNLIKCCHANISIDRHVNHYQRAYYAIVDTYKQNFRYTI